MAPAGAEFPRGGAGRMGRPLGARLVGSGDRGGCGARGPAVAPDGGCGRPRRDRAGLRRQRRRPGPGWRGERGAAGAPPAGRVRGRLRGAGAGARAGARGGYDDPAAGPRILSPPPPPHGSPSSRLRTRHTGGESARAGEVPGRGRPPIGSPRGTGRAARGLSGRPACGDRLSPGRRGAGEGERPPTRDRDPAARPLWAAEGVASPRKAGRLRARFRATPPASCHFFPGRVVVLK